MKIKKPFFCLFIAAALLLGGTAGADTLIVEETEITDTYLYETTPTLSSDVVVYTAREMLNTGFFDQGDIWYQDLNNLGVGPVQITSDLTDDKLNDISGDYIVYTAYDTTMSSTGTIMLYQISTEILQPIGDPLVIQEPRIHGDTLVWVQGAVGSSEVMVYNLAWLGTMQAAESLTGPIPPAFNVDIGSRFAVWVEKDGDYDIGAWDFVNLVRIKLTDTPLVDERHPSTSGDWIVWEARDHDATNKRIEAVNLETGDYRIIVDDGFVSARPSVHGDLIAYENDIEGNKDIYVYRISTGETFAVTTSPDDEYLSDVFGDMVAYVNYHQELTGEYDEDVWVAALTPDSDGDGIPDYKDSCPDEDASGFDADGDGCIDSTGGLKDIIEWLLGQGVIDAELETSLLTKVENAEKSADKDNICAAVNQLEALIAQVDNQSGNKIPTDTAVEIIAYVESVINYFLDQLPPGESC